MNESALIVEESRANIGAGVMGRNMFGPIGGGDWGDGQWKGWWGDDPPYHNDVFIVTHHPREPVEMEGGTTYHFVTDGIERALERAKEVAGGQDIMLWGGAHVINQYLAAGLLDELELHDAAGALRPLAGHLASTLFGLGFLGAALLAAAIGPLSTAYSVGEAFGARADINDSFQEARLFYCSYGLVVVLAAAIVLIPGAPLIPILFLSQALNAVLLLVLLPFMRNLALDPEVMGAHVLGARGRWITGITFALIAVSVTVLAVLTIF